MYLPVPVFEPTSSVFLGESVAHLATVAEVNLEGRIPICPYYLFQGGCVFDGMFLLCYNSLPCGTKRYLCRHSRPTQEKPA